MPLRTLRLAIIQDNPTVGDIAGNMRRAKALTEANRDADLVVFSECFATAYPLEDLVRRAGFRARVREAVDDFARFVAATNGPAVLMGAPLDGRDLPYNAAILLSPDGGFHTACKRDLPNTDVFDEVRVFAPGSASAPMPLRGYRLGVGICEEMWHDRVSADLAGELADVLVFINGSPFEQGKQQLRIKQARRRVRETGLPLVYSNQVGGQDSEVYDGASFALNREGRIVAQLPAFQTGVMRLILEGDEESGYDIKPDGPEDAVASYPDSLGASYQAVVLAVRDYVRKNGFNGALLGLSGGIDSALVAAIATDAIGPGNVHCRMLPSDYTSSESVEDAVACANLLGAEYRSIAIRPAITAFDGILADEFQNFAEDVTEENIQARARGIVLMAISNKKGWLVLSTGNKSEYGTGYCTLYGDMCGGFAVIKDIYKTEVFDACRWRNAHHVPWFLGPRGEVIPERILTKPPSAELKPGQTDEQSLGDYPMLDAVLKALVEQELGPVAAADAAGRALGRDIDPDYAARIARLVKRAEYKRRQAPPGPKVTSRPFGKGWRYPITNHADL